MGVPRNAAKQNMQGQILEQLKNNNKKTKKETTSKQQTKKQKTANKKYNAEK